MIGTDALDQRTLDLGIAPASDSGIDIGRDIRRSGDESRRGEGEAAARQGVFDDGPAVGVARRVAIAAGHDGVDEITAAFGRWFSHRAIRCSQHQEAADEPDPKHVVAPVRDACIARRIESRQRVRRN
jgi:hypothetical protein